MRATCHPKRRTRLSLAGLCASCAAVARAAERHGQSPDAAVRIRVEAERAQRIENRAALVVLDADERMDSWDSDSRSSSTARPAPSNLTRTPQKQPAAQLGISTPAGTVERGSAFSGPTSGREPGSQPKSSDWTPETSHVAAWAASLCLFAWDGHSTLHRCGCTKKRGHAGDHGCPCGTTAPQDQPSVIPAKNDATR